MILDSSFKNGRPHWSKERKLKSYTSKLDFKFNSYENESFSFCGYFILHGDIFHCK